jgi:uncharacterized protein (TIGR00730 family)
MKIIWHKGVLYVGLLVMSILSSLSSQSVSINVAVFCSADDKASSQYKQVAHELGGMLAKHQFGLITGGSKTGLMKEVVDGYVLASPVRSTVFRNNVHGVMLQAFADFDVHHPSIPSENFQWVDTIHERFTVFHELADVIIVLPGGFGTLHELLDFLVHKQFGLIEKSIILFNSNGYWNPLLLQFQNMVTEQLLTEKSLAGLQVVDSTDACVKAIIASEDTTSTQGLHDRYWER